MKETKIYKFPQEQVERLVEADAEAHENSEVSPWIDSLTEEKKHDLLTVEWQEKHNVKRKKTYRKNDILRVLKEEISPAWNEQIKDLQFEEKEYFVNIEKKEAKDIVNYFSEVLEFREDIVWGVLGFLSIGVTCLLFTYTWQYDSWRTWAENKIAKHKETFCAHTSKTFQENEKCKKEFDKHFLGDNDFRFVEHDNKEEEKDEN